MEDKGGIEVLADMRAWWPLEYESGANLDTPFAGSA